MQTHVWTPPPGTAALIFDCDGTLADTMPAHYKAWLALLGRYGIPFPEPRFYAMGGMPTASIIRVLAGEAGVAVPDVDGMVREKEATFLTFLDAVEPVEAVLMIAAAHRGKVPIAVASGGYRDTITRTLDRLNVRDWFDAIVTAEDTARHKPDPDVFLEAARRLGAEPPRCVVFEDTDIGLEAARRAGMLGVDVRPWVTRAPGA
ncbi:HAD family phosphatase [Gemmata sp. JC717]|uniref:HAD family hydrolase n=1 Tax=Gemmata algarum TaxID=2975278 RepID=UPI0021BB7B76|nr:HAD family phosphatase [Gemmata algarum]MDY3554671.1 HAD family phosphatase [Gemmata algarum]